MIPNNIYVQGSYIDIHDIENVYLSVDKGEVHIGKNCYSQEQEVPTEIPSVLQTPEAEVILQKLVKSEMLTDEWQPISLSLAEKGMLASFLAEKLEIKNLWQVFAPLWGVKPESLRRAWNKALDQNKSAAFMKKLNMITK